MMDSMVSANSKFLPYKSKSVQRFAMPTIALNDSLSPPMEQVKYFLINPSFRKCEITSLFFVTEIVHALRSFLGARKGNRESEGLQL